MANVGYIRVSTVEQNTARQLKGVELDKVFTDMTSGKNKDRPALLDCLKYLRDGDILHIHSVDRLARDLKDLLEITSELIRNGVKIIFHKENLVFDGRESPVQKALLQFMGLMAELERNLMRERQREGIAIARAAGKYKGRKPILSKIQVKEIRKLAEVKFSVSYIARKYSVSRNVVYNALGRGVSDCYAKID